MRVTVLVVGRAGTPFRDAIHEYEERAARYWKLQVIEVSSGAGGKGKASPERVTHVEEVKLLKKIPSWSSNGIPSREMCTSLSRICAPCARAAAKEARVFSGQSPAAPRCPMTVGLATSKNGCMRLGYHAG